MKALDYSMGKKKFSQAVQLINENLMNQPLERAFNSIGSNIFFEFGKLKEIEFPNGKKNMQRDWSLWISLASWRINKGDKYIVGSGDAPQSIQSNIQLLIGKRFQSFRFLSQFLDAEFNFEDGYQITTFFNWAEEDQWSLLLPDDSSIGVDCSTAEEIQNVQGISQQFRIKESYKKIDSSLQKTVVTNISFNEWNLPFFHLKNGSSIHLEACAWRLEKNSNYIIGCLDEDHDKIKNELTHLIGKKLKQIDIANPMMDTRIQFEDGYVLKTFSCCRIEEQWKIYKEKELIFSANIPLLEIQPS